MATIKTRLDIYLTEKGLCPTRAQARALIMAGAVFVNGQKENKPGFFITKPDPFIDIRTKACPYVSRGGLKLEKAVKEFSLDLSEKICMDIGASTGGFTDCMLQYGAKKVYAIDVGYGQLDYKLRKDARVSVFEKTNFRHINKEVLGILDNANRPEFGCADVSFISLDKILPAAAEILSESAKFVALIKPQFEAGKGLVPKSGIVTDKDIHIKAITDVLLAAAHNSFFAAGLTYSPIKGGKGNIEYLVLFDRARACAQTEAFDEGYDKSFIIGIVEEAHRAMNPSLD